MKNIFCILTIAFILLFLSGCYSKSNSKENMEVTNCVQMDLTSSVDTLSLLPFVENVEVIPLRLVDNEVIGEVSQIYFTDSLLYVIDRRLKMVVCFDREGQWKHTFNEVGPGPKEYLSLNNFWVHNDVMYVYDSRQFRLNLYTLSGTYLRTIPCEKYFSDITMVSDSTFLCYCPDDVMNNPKGMWLMNEKGMFEKMLLSYDEKYPVVSTSWKYMYRDKMGNHCIYSQIDNSSYRYCNDTLQLNWRLDMVQKTVASYPGLSNSAHIKNECYIPVCIVDGTEWLWSVWGNKKEGTMKFALYDKQEELLEISDLISVTDLFVSELGRPVPTNLPDALVTVIPQEYDYVLQIYHFKKRTT